MQIQLFLVHGLRLAVSAENGALTIQNVLEHLRHRVAVPYSVVHNSGDMVAGGASQEEIYTGQQIVLWLDHKGPPRPNQSSSQQGEVLRTTDFFHGSVHIA